MERAAQRIKLSHSQIEEICRKYFKNTGSLQNYKILSGGAINTTYKILWDNEYFVLRFYVRGKHFADVEKQVYSLVQDKVPVPELLFTSTADDTYSFAIFRFVEAKHLFEIEKNHSSTVSYELGKVLSKIHSFRFPRAGLFGQAFTIETSFEENSSPYFEYCLEHLSESSNTWKRLGNTRAKKLKHFIEIHKGFFPVVQNGGVLVHSDFKPVNLLWNEQKGITVLDWEFAHIGHGLIDFGILLRHFQDFPLNIKCLEKGYKDNNGDLPTDWIQRARITDFINVVQLLNVQAERPKLFHLLLESVDFTMNKWRELDETIRGL